MECCDRRRGGGIFSKHGGKVEACAAGMGEAYGEGSGLRLKRLSVMSVVLPHGDMSKRSEGTRQQVLR